MSEEILNRASVVKGLNIDKGTIKEVCYQASIPKGIAIYAVRHKSLVAKKHPHRYNPFRD
jgi:hypothetical protein